MSSILHYFESLWVQLSDSSWSKVDMLIINIILYTKPTKNLYGARFHRNINFSNRHDEYIRLQNDVKMILSYT